MQIAKVVGVAVSTVKDARLEGAKLLLVSDTDQNGEPQGAPYIALDMVGAGESELVMVVRGSSARAAAGDMSRPVDAAIVGILNSLRYEGSQSFRKS